MCLGAFIQLAVKSASCMTVYVCSGRENVLKQQKNSSLAVRILGCKLEMG